MVIILGMCGLQATELHGNLSQAQRLEALETFKRGESKILVATDLASRGLDVKGVAGSYTHIRAHETPRHI